MKVRDIDFSQQFVSALDKLEHSHSSLFITGHAGTGKSTLLDHFRNTTKQNVVILAPTGVAALNVKGQTIHSFFGFRPGTTPDKIKRYYRNRGKKGFYKIIDAIVIDEISMVRADLLDCVDEFLRLHGKDPQKPFGGTRMIFIGDLYQLPPVVTNDERDLFKTFYQSPYFFSAKVMKHFDLELVNLTKVYRQSDQEFINLLGDIRTNNLQEQQLSLLNKRHKQDFDFDSHDLYLYLTTTNRKADQVNQNFLAKLAGKRYTFTGYKEGDFDKRISPSAEKLELKIGAQVMLINNDKAGRWVNGSIGKVDDIIKLGPGKDIVVVELDDGSLVEVLPHTWEMFKFLYNPATDKLQAESVGSYTQYPLILSWAITIHKSQGKTFEKVVIDFGWGTFAHGQAYVALSRCRTLEGIVLSKPFQKRHIITDSRINHFFKEYSFSQDPWNLSREDKLALINQALESGQLVKLVYQLDENNQKKHMINPLKEAKNGLIDAYCHILGEELVLKLDSVRQMELVEGIN